MILFKIIGLEQYFTLSYVKASQARLAAVYADHRLMVIAAYMAVYILVTSLSLPGAAIMTLAAGALFGLLIGTIVVSFASTIHSIDRCCFPPKLPKKPLAKIYRGTRSVKHCKNEENSYLLRQVNRRQCTEECARNY
ncbi:MAG: hypothetical protein ACLPN1_02720 [Dissulfurispiraceae bacterium]